MIREGEKDQQKKIRQPTQGLNYMDQTILLCRIIWRIKNIYSHFESYLGFDLIQVDQINCGITMNGPLTKYVKLPVAHAPGMPGTFSPPPTSKETAS